MMERLGWGDGASDEGSLETGSGACKGSVGESSVVGWSGGRVLGAGEKGGSVLVLLTGLREKRDFLGDFVLWVEEGIMPGGDRERERASACESPSTDTKPDCNWCEKASGREQLTQFIFGQKRVHPVRTKAKHSTSSPLRTAQARTPGFSTSSASFR